jgi:hypothetical protein
MAEHLLIVPLLRWTVDASRINKRSGVRDHGLDPKAAKTTLISCWHFSLIDASGLPWFGAAGAALSHSGR